jgi:hypothetical protein
MAACPPTPTPGEPLPRRFRRNDHPQILNCRTDDIRWTVYGAFRLEGKRPYDEAIERGRG